MQYLKISTLIKNRDKAKVPGIFFLICFLISQYLELDFAVIAMSPQRKFCVKDNLPVGAKSGRNWTFPQ
jgi:hypothetical protein